MMKLTLVLILISHLAWSGNSPPLPQLPVNDPLQKNVDFWITIYSKLNIQQGVLHDAKYIDHIYTTFDFAKNHRSKSQIIKNSKKKWKQVLLSLHHKENSPDALKRENLTQDEKKAFDLFQDIQEPNKYLHAAHRKRLHFQLGQKDNFLHGLSQSGQFLSRMEDIFKKAGIPFELTRLPFVESNFNLQARSKVGASGIWQFMKSTAQLFIRVDPVIDERNDPIRATVAAAQLLQFNFNSLGTWPLAITAYNHGRKGMMRAVRKVGSDHLDALLLSYRNRSFGFASSNFYAELLAVIELEKNAKKYFGKIEYTENIQFIEAELPHSIHVRNLIHGLKWNLRLFRKFNPGLTEAVYQGTFFIPKGYSLRIPFDSHKDEETVRKEFWKKYAQIPSSLKLKTQNNLKYDTSEESVKLRIKNRNSQLR